jgi:PPK2 family polyphosphate:nucleotide phosphotransferase
MSDLPYHPKPGDKIRLKDFDPDDTGGYNKTRGQEELKSLQTRMAELQEMMYAQGTQALLVVLQALDAGGKDGTIKKVFDAVNPVGVKVAAFKQPSAEELAHDFLWRIHQQAPPKGYIGIFNRSQYEDVLIVRVNELVPKAVWEKRYDQINHFEKLLAETGTHILKFYLNISKDEQKERLQARLDNPDKWWKFDAGDLPVREKWDSYMAAYEDALTRCNTDHAPWIIVPANKKWYRDLVVTRTIVETMETMGLAYPQAKQDLSGVVISD